MLFFSKILSAHDMPSLEEVLGQHGLSSEGEGWVDSVSQLLQQLQSGECVLGVRYRGEGLGRVAYRAQAVVHRLLSDAHTQKLVEVVCEKNGVSQKVSHTSRSISEKVQLLLGESFSQALVRCFKEELQIEDISPERFTHRCEIQYGFSTSSSFPIPSASIVHQYEVLLPKEHWREFFEESRDGKYTRWEWRDV